MIKISTNSEKPAVREALLLEVQHQERTSTAGALSQIIAHNLGRVIHSATLTVENSGGYPVMGYDLCWGTNAHGFYFTNQAGFNSVILSTGRFGYGLLPGELYTSELRLYAIE